MKRAFLILPFLLIAACATAPKPSALPEVDQQGGGGFVPGVEREVTKTLLGTSRFSSNTPPSDLTLNSLTLTAPNAAVAATINQGTTICLNGPTCTKTLSATASQLTLSGLHYTTNNAFISNLASGTGFQISNTGVWIDLGGGTSDRMKSDGTNILSDTSILPVTNAASDLGGTSFQWNKVYTATVQSAGSTLTMNGNLSDSATSVAVSVNSFQTYTTSGAKLLSIRNNSTEKAYFDKDGVATALAFVSSAASGNSASLSGGKFIVAAASGKIALDATDSSGTPGAATINKPSGQVAVAASSSSVVVTNSLVSTSSIVFGVSQGSDATCGFVQRVVPAAGSFTIFMNANCTAANKVGFVVYN